MRSVELREDARRQHRAIALLGVLQCWNQGWDGIVLEREELERVLKLRRFRKTRLKWLRDDVLEAFPYMKSINYTTGELASLYVSRKPFEMPFSARPLRTEERIARLKEEQSVVFGAFRLWGEPEYRALRKVSSVFPALADDGNLDQRLLTATLALIGQGLLTVSAAVPPPERE